MKAPMPFPSQTLRTALAAALCVLVTACATPTAQSPAPQTAASPAKPAPAQPANAARPPAPGMATSPNARAISEFRAHLAAGQLKTCAIQADRTVVCWGGSFGVSGPVPVAGLPGALAVAAGEDHQCAIRLDGRTLCWGGNANGQLGDGGKTNSDMPVPVTGLNDAMALALGNGFSCALKLDRTVVCWGDNKKGQLGDGTVQASAEPKPVKNLSDVTGLFAGAQHVCALQASGALSCWGGNASGQLGDGTKADRRLPVAVKGLNTGTVWAGLGWDHSCALKTGGALVCWGDNAKGQLGTGNNRASTTPVSVTGVTNVSVLAVGGDHVCTAVNPSGAVSCWGNNQFGQLGSFLKENKNQNRPTPVAKLSNPSLMAGGYNHTCAVDATGTAQCWGRNSHSQLGTGRADNEFAPAEVAGKRSYLK